MNKNEVLLDIIKENIKQEILEEERLKKKESAKNNILFEIFEGNTYVNIDLFLNSVKDYFGIDSDAFTRELYKNGVLYHNGNRYIPNEDFEGIVLLKNGKLFVNRDEIDKYLVVYLLERMSIKNIKESFEIELQRNKFALIQELYNVSNAEFQRNSPVFESIRLGHNKKSEIDM